MPRHSWFDKLLSLSRPSGQEVQGLVLSGGGSRASFHIGALRYLYEVANVAPTCIVGTSAGSIVGAMLSQSLDPKEQTKALHELENLWLAMSRQEDMYVEQAWFTRLRGQWDDIADLLTQHVLPDMTSDPAETVVETDNDDSPAELVMRAMTEDPSQDVTMTRGILWQLAGSLARLGRAGAGLATSVRGAERAASAFRPGPIVKQLLFESSFDPAKVGASGVRLRIAFVDLNSGELRFMRQDGVIVDREDHPIGDNSFDLTLGVWSSCALPGVFRPVKLGDEVYVDGGVRENVPVEMAVASLGVTKPYVIVAAPPGVDTGDYTNKDAVALMMRVATLVLDETIQDEVEWARAAGACVIQPRVDVHSPMTVDKALLHINRDYGWMRAAEEVTNASAANREINDALIQARCQWAGLLNQSGKRAANVAAVREQIHELLGRANTALLPPGHEKWDRSLM